MILFFLFVVYAECYIRSYQPPLSSFFHSPPTISGSSLPKIYELEPYIDRAHPCVSGVSGHFNSTPQLFSVDVVLTASFIYTDTCSSIRAGDFTGTEHVDMVRWLPLFRTSATQSVVQRFSDLLFVRSSGDYVRFSGCEKQMDDIVYETMKNKTIVGDILLGMARASCASRSRIRDIQLVTVSDTELVNESVAGGVKRLLAWQEMYTNASSIPFVRLESFSLEFECISQFGTSVVVPVRTYMRTAVELRMRRGVKGRYPILVHNMKRLVQKGLGRMMKYTAVENMLPLFANTLFDTNISTTSEYMQHIDREYAKATMEQRVEQIAFFRTTLGTSLLAAWIGGVNRAGLHACLAMHQLLPSGRMQTYIDDTIINVLADVYTTIPLATHNDQTLCGMFMSPHARIDMDAGSHHGKKWQFVTSPARSGLFPRSHGIRDVLRSVSGMTSYASAVANEKAIVNIFTPNNDNDTDSVGVYFASVGDKKQKTVMDELLTVFRDNTTDLFSLYSKVKNVVVADTSAVLRIMYRKSGNGSFDADLYDKMSVKDPGLRSPRDGLWIDQKHNAMRLELARSVSLPLFTSASEKMSENGEQVSVEFRVMHGMATNLKYQAALLINDMLEMDMTMRDENVEENASRIFSMVYETFASFFFQPEQPNEPQKQNTSSPPTPPHPQPSPQPSPVFKDSENDESIVNESMEEVNF